MLCRRLGSNFFTGPLGDLFKLFIDVPFYFDSEKTSSGSVNYVPRFGQFTPQSCLDQKFRVGANVTTLGECESCRAQNKYAIGPQGKCTHPEVEAAVKRDFLSEILFKPSSDLVLRRAAAANLPMISLKPVSDEFSFRWSVSDPSALPKSIKLGKTSGEVLVGFSEGDIPVNFDAAGLYGTNGTESQRGSITFSGESLERNVSVNISKLDVSVNVRALPSIQLSQTRLLIDDQVRTYRESFDVTEDTSMFLRIDAVDEDGLALSGESFWFMAMRWQLSDLGNDHPVTIPVRYDPHDGYFKAMICCTKAMVGQHELWISEVHTNNNEQYGKPALQPNQKCDKTNLTCEHDRAQQV